MPDLQCITFTVIFVFAQTSLSVYGDLIWVLAQIAAPLASIFALRWIGEPVCKYGISESCAAHLCSKFNSPKVSVWHPFSAVASVSCRHAFRDLSILLHRHTENLTLAVKLPFSTRKKIKTNKINKVTNHNMNFITLRLTRMRRRLADKICRSRRTRHSFCNNNAFYLVQK